jgi:hypothetical protein
MRTRRLGIMIALRQIHLAASFVSAD